MSKLRRILFTLLALSFILAACAPADPAPSDEELQQTIEVVVALTQLAQNVATEAPTQTPAATDAAPTSTVAPVAGSSVVVVFTPGGLFDDAKRAEFHARLLDPFIQYYADLSASGDHPALVSINVQTFDDPDYPYSADAIFDGGGYIGFLITETDGLITLWVPECMGGACPLSDTFRDAFPDIAATADSY